MGLIGSGLGCGRADYLVGLGAAVGRGIFGAGSGFLVGGLIAFFHGFFASIRGVFIFAGGLGSRLWFNGV